MKRTIRTKKGECVITYKHGSSNFGLVAPYPPRLMDVVKLVITAKKSKIVGETVLIK